MTDERKDEPVVTANDQGADAVAQAGVVAHNDIAAATNDPTDAPKLEVEPAAFEPTPAQIATGDALIASEAAEQAQVDALGADEIAALESDGAPTLPDQTPAPDVDPLGPATDELPTTGGIWQCQNLECPNQPTREFEAAAQQHIQFSGVPLHCPFCNSVSVLYLYPTPEKPQEVA